MGDMRDEFDALKEYNKERRAKNFAEFKSLEDILVEVYHFKRHTEWHYNVMLDCDLLNYWPSSSKWHWRGKTYHGRTRHLLNFLENRKK